MNNHSQYVQIRTKKIGLLIYNARKSAFKSVEEVSKMTGISVERLSAFEKGKESPSLPEMEILAYTFNLPIDHFWGNQILKDQNINQSKFKQVLELRQRLIGVNLKKMRLGANISVDDLSERTGIPQETIQRYELGELSIPVPELELISETLNKTIEAFYDYQGIIGKWRLEQKEIEKIKSLPEDLRDFVSKPVNLPYLELAVRLSELDVSKLRLVAEGLLEITY